LSRQVGVPITFDLRLSIGVHSFNAADLPARQKRTKVHYFENAF